jgi:hypothetical protein
MIWIENYAAPVITLNPFATTAVMNLHGYRRLLIQLPRENSGKTNRTTSSSLAIVVLLNAPKRFVVCISGFGLVPSR